MTLMRRDRLALPIFSAIVRAIRETRNLEGRAADS
jgi:hypothetical protein